MFLSRFSLLLAARVLIPGASPTAGTCLGQENLCSDTTTGGGALLQTATVLEKPTKKRTGTTKKNVEEGTENNIQDEVTIEFSSVEHADTETNVDMYEKSIESDQLFYYYGRPEWQKTLRCTSDDVEDCEECSDTKDCWTSVQGTGSMNDMNSLRTVDLSGSLKYTKFVNLIHVKCVTNLLKVQLVLKNLDSGTLRIFFDGDELNFANYGGEVNVDEITSTGLSTGSPLTSIPYSPSYLSFKLGLSKKDGHEFRLEYIPGERKQGQYIKLSGVRFFMDDEFMQCEDTQVCLQVLADSDAGMLLRQNNELQLSCLAKERCNDDGDICCQWRECLEANGGQHGSRILTLLKAAGVTPSEETSEETSMNTSRSSKTQSKKQSSSKSKTRIKSLLQASDESPQCINPPTEDPESWDCDCYDVIETSCTAIADTEGWTIERCTQAVFCIQEGVCEDWKEDSCTEDWIAPLAEALSENAALLQHANGNQKRTKTLNEAAGGKSCQ